MRNAWLTIGLVVLWALPGWSQCTELPYTSGGTAVPLGFCGNLTVSGGTCSQVASNVVQCSVSEGTTGTVNLSAQRTPTGTVTISAAALPTGWSSFAPVSGSGSVSAQYRFTVPAETAGRRFELTFQATAAGVPSAITLTVILDVLDREGAQSATCFHAFWTHGSGVQLENPEAAVSVTRLGYATHVVGSRTRADGSTSPFPLRSSEPATVAPQGVRSAFAIGSFACSSGSTRAESNKGARLGW